MAGGFGIGTATVYRYVHGGLDVLAAVPRTLENVLEVARHKAFVILDGALLPIDRGGMASGRDPRVRLRETPAARRDVQVLADPVAG